ncbi:MAG: energy-coupling factor ABC transporter ATP-binding protein [Synergistaceae bacterium]|jgi:energy-coupling factor transport system ATP-binding protein|nr:energy-coupling factor ABC transporter ATP-binding protein [Synergistaceae bacterium]
MPIVADNISYAYNVGTSAESVALRGVSFTVERGEWVSVVGHTGSGKSTLAQHLNLLLTPRSGSVSIDGAEAKPGSGESRVARRRVGLVFQYPETQFFAETVRAEIEFAPSNWGVSGGALKACVDEAVSASGLDPALLESNPFALSGGQRRRVAIASVIAMRPDYLVLDEPTAGLDAAGIRELIQFLSGVRDAGLGVVQVTHDLRSALSYSDRILVLENGSRVVSGTPEFVARHIIDNPVRGLVIPPVVRFADALRKKGMNVPLICEVDEMVRAIGIYKERNKKCGS